LGRVARTKLDDEAKTPTNEPRDAVAIKKRYRRAGAIFQIPSALVREARGRGWWRGRGSVGAPPPPPTEVVTPWIGVTKAVANVPKWAAG